MRNILRTNQVDNGITAGKYGESPNAVLLKFTKVMVVPGILHEYASTTGTLCVSYWPDSISSMYSTEGES